MYFIVFSPNQTFPCLVDKETPFVNYIEKPCLDSSQTSIVNMCFSTNVVALDNVTGQRWLLQTMFYCYVTGTCINGQPQQTQASIPNNRPMPCNIFKKKSNEQLYVQPRILVQFLKRHISLSDLWMQIGLCAKCLGMDLTRRLFVHTVLRKPFVLFRYFEVCQLLCRIRSNRSEWRCWKRLCGNINFFISPYTFHQLYVCASVFVSFSGQVGGASTARIS